MLLEMHRHGLVSLKATWLLDGVSIGRSRTNRSLLHGSADATVSGTSWRFQQKDRRTWVVLDVEMSRYGRTLYVVLPNDLEPVSGIFLLWLAAVTLDGVGVRVGIATSS